MPLHELYLATGPQLVSLQPLHGLQLRSLALSASKLTDLSPLEGMPLRELSLTCRSIRDLAPLASLPLERLDLFGCINLRNLEVVGRFSRLTDLILPEGPPAPDRLRTLPHLRYLSRQRVGTRFRWTTGQTAADFWKDRDQVTPPAR